MKRVLHIVSSLGSGSGVLSVLMNYHRQIDRTRLQFDYLSFRQTEGTYESEILTLGGRVYHCSRPSLAPAFQRELESFFRAHAGEYDIIHCHPLFASAVFAPAAKRHGVTRVIQHSHTSRFSAKPLSAARNFLTLLFFGRRATDYAACSEAAKRVFFWVKPQNVYLMENAIDLTHFAFSPEARSAIRNAYQIPEDAVVLGHVGRFSREKNHKFLLEVFAQYLLLQPSARLLLIGDGAEMDAVRRQAESLGCAGRVIFAGRTGEVARLYSAMDLFLLPSIFEGLGLVALEAQANGLPCLVSDRVPEEARLGPALSFLPLEAGSLAWAQALAEISPHRRLDAIPAGTRDIRQAARSLEQYYLGAE